MRNYYFLIREYSLTAILLMTFPTMGESAINIKAFASPTALTKVQTLTRCLTQSDTIPFTSRDIIYALSIDATIQQPCEASFVRIVLEDVEGHNYLVAESDRFRNDTTTVRLSQYCEETALLDGITPTCLKCYLTGDATLTLTGIHTSDEEPMRPVSKTEDFKKAQVQDIVHRINEYNVKHGKLWQAGVTRQSLLLYDDLTDQGISDPYTSNFKYYVQGLYEVGERSLNQSLVSSDYVDSFDWGHRHGKDFWITPVRNQLDTDLCSIFAAVGLTEAISNLYYNSNLNLDLSEEDIATYIQLLYPNDTTNWHREQNILGYICSQGVIDEQSLPFSHHTYPSPINPRPEGIENIKCHSLSSLSSLDESKVKKALITSPQISGIRPYGSFTIGHEMLLVGFNKVTSGYYWEIPASAYDHYISSLSPLIGETYWIFKNSWGTELYENEGYAHIIFHNYSYMRPLYSINAPLESKVPRHVAVEDNDGDGLFNWGIGSRPSTVPSWLKNDADDSNADLGWMDSFGHITIINPNEVDTLTIQNDSVLTINQYMFRHVKIPPHRTLTVACNIIMNKTTEIHISPEGTLIVNGGTIKNGRIRSEAGSSIVLNNGGTIVVSKDDIFTLPCGALMQISEGTIY